MYFFRKKWVGGEKWVGGVKIISMTVGLAAIVLLSTAGSVSAWEWVGQPPKIERQPWQLSDARESSMGSKLKLKVDASYCSGERRPVLLPPKSVRQKHRIVIRTSVKWPEPLKASGPVNPGEAAPACADLVAVLHRAVRLGTHSRDFDVFDGYFSPPRLVAAWPAKRMF